jgi:hypothetical protein
MRYCPNCRRSLLPDSAAQRRYCEHLECQRERARVRKRKSRGTQWVLVRFLSDRNADGELRKYSIVNLDLDRERPTIVRGRDGVHRYPDDVEGRRLDEWATYWIEDHATAAPRRRRYVKQGAA